jgi:hypothetical protein
MEYPLLDLLKSKRVILASTSPRRFEILTQLGLRNIEVVAPSFEENLNKSDYTPEEVCIDSTLNVVSLKQLLTWIVRSSYCNREGSISPASN